MTTNLTLASSAAFFEEKYRTECDPWNFSGSEYELGRYEAIIGALAPNRYRRAFEPGCSIGVLTERLSTLCDSLKAIDFSPTAVAHAQNRCSHLRNVEILCASIPERSTVTGFDLIVLSEIGYYFSAEEWTRVSVALIDPMPMGGTLLAAHWLGNSKDHCIHGDEVHDSLLSLPGIRREYSERHETFRIDRWVRI